MNRVLLSLSLSSMGALIFLPFVHFSANRLQSGQALGLLGNVSDNYLIFILFFCLFVLAVFWRYVPKTLATLAASLLAIAGLLYWFYLSGSLAIQLSQDASETARVSLGSAFWLLLLFFSLMVLDAWQRSFKYQNLLILMMLMGVLLVGIWFYQGHFNQMSIMKEYLNDPERFQAAFYTHIQLVLWVLFPTMMLAIPLGWLAWRKAYFGHILFNLLNIIQTIPSIALFAFLMLPLAALVNAYPQLRAWGVSGIGTLPAIIALIFYTLLPLVRNTHSALNSVSAPILEAAQAMGMSKKQILFSILMPLSLPIILSGIRIVLVQSIGLVVIAALIGAGGLGIFVWEGLGEYALDLVLLGAIPTIFLALIADLLMQWLIKAIEPKGRAA